MELTELEKRLSLAISKFLKSNQTLLIQDANEESITTLLHSKIEDEFPDWKWDIDHLYNRRIIKSNVVRKQTEFLLSTLPKSKIPKNIYKDSGRIGKTIIPDIIFHDRDSSDHNFLVIEVKKSTNKNKEDRDFDFLKLETLTSKDLKYEYGLFIDFTAGKEFNLEAPYQMQFIINGKWHE